MTVDTPVATATLDAVVVRDELERALDFTKTAVPTRPAVPVLAGVLLTAEDDRLVVSTFDYETSTTDVVPAPGGARRACGTSPTWRACRTRRSLACSTGILPYARRRGPRAGRDRASRLPAQRGGPHAQHPAVVGILGVVSFDTTLYGASSTLFGIAHAACDAGFFVSLASLRIVNRKSLQDAFDMLRNQEPEGSSSSARNARSRATW